MDRRRPIESAQANPLLRTARVEGPVANANGRTWYVEACRQHPPKLTSAVAEGF